MPEPFLPPVLDLLGLIILLIIGIVILVLIVKVIFFILPAAVVAFVAWFLTESTFLAGVAFLIIILITISRRR